MSEDQPAGIDEAPMSKYAVFGDFIGRKITQIQERFLADDPRARGDLARLRRTIGKPVGADAETWPVVFKGFPNVLLGRGDAPSPYETAAHLALGLFAQHMQSASRPMHRPGMGLGRAVRQLANPADSESREKPVMRRFQALGTASSLSEAVYHARSMIQQLRGEEIALDYVRLAQDFVDLQNPRTADAVRLRWARDLYRTDSAAAELTAASTA